MSKLRARMALMRDIRVLALSASMPEAPTSAPVRSAEPSVAAAGANARHRGERVLMGARLVAVGNWIAEQLKARVRGLESDLVAALRSNDPATGGDDAVDRLFIESDRLCRSAYAAMGQEAEGMLERLAHGVAGMARAMRAEHHGLTGGLPDLKGIVDAPILGATMAEHFEKQGLDAAFRFKAAVRQSRAAGEGLDDMVRRVAGDAGARVDACDAFGCGHAVMAGDAAGHEFHGNQWTQEKLDAVTQPLRKRAMIGDEVSWIKPTGELGFGSMGFRSGEPLRPSGMGKKEWKDKAEFEVIEHGTGEKHVVHNLKLRMPAGGFRNREFTNARDRANAASVVRAGLADDLLKEAALRALKIHVRLADTGENAVDKVIQAAVQLFAGEAEGAAADEDDFDDEDDQDEAAEDQRRMGWTWVAILDARTCQFCEDLDGTVYDSEMNPVDGGPDFPGEPPVHLNCRCHLAATDLDEEAAPRQSFDEWLAGLSRSEQEEAFGKQNLRAYHRGDMSAQQLIGQKDHMIALDDFLGEQDRPNKATGIYGFKHVVRSVDWDEGKHPRTADGKFGDAGGAGAAPKVAPLAVELGAMKRWEDARAQSAAAKGVQEDDKAKAVREKKLKEMKRLAEWKARKNAELAAKPTVEREAIQKAAKDAARGRRQAREQKAMEDAQKEAAANKAPSPDPVEKGRHEVKVFSNMAFREKRISTALSNQERVEVKNNKGGINDTQRVSIDTTVDGKKEAVVGFFKPVEGENWKFRGAQVRGQCNDKDATAAGREVAAYGVAKAMGIDVPVAAHAKIGGKAGSFMEEAVGKPGRDLEGNEPKKRVTELAMFDVAIGNTDRHGGNFMISDDHKTVTPIDNGFSFPDRPGNRGSDPRYIGGNSSRLVAAAGARSGFMDDEAFKHAKEMAVKMSSPAFRKEAERVMRAEGIKDDGVKLMNARVDYMVRKIGAAPNHEEMSRAFRRIWARSWSGWE